MRGKGTEVGLDFAGTGGMKPAFPVVITSAFAVGCAPTFAAPIRSMHEAARAPLPEGRVEVSAGTVYAVAGSPSVAIGLTDHLRLELGGDFSPAWALGFGGLRYALAEGPFLADAELGAGAGVGGQLCGNTTSYPNGSPSCWDGLRWHERFTFGGYTGLGVGLRHAWFEWSLRGRFQLAAATNVPATVWLSVATGPEFSLSEHVSLAVASGIAMFRSGSRSHFEGPIPIGNLGLSYRF